MSAGSKTYWTIACNRCKTEFDDGDYFVWSDQSTPRELAQDYDWLWLDGQDICDNCVTDEDRELLEARDVELAIWQRKSRELLCSQGVHSYLANGTCRCCFKSREENKNDA